MKVEPAVIDNNNQFRSSSFKKTSRLVCNAYYDFKKHNLD